MIPKSLTKITKMLTLRRRASYIVGIDIGISSVKVVGMRMGKAPSVWFYSIADLPENCGERYVTEAIQKILKERNFPSRDAVLTFTDESITIRRIELPRMTDDEILDALRWQAKDIIHFDIDKASLDFKILGEVQREDGSKFTELLFVAASKEVIDKKIQILKAANLNVISIYVSPFGLENVVKINDDIKPSGTMLAIDFGYAKTEISVFKNNTLEFVRTVPIGSEQLSEAIAAASVSTEKGDIQLSEEEAEDVKIRLGIPYEETALERGITSVQILSLMRPILERFSKEIRRSIEYYIQEYGRDDIKEVYLVGTGSRLKNLDRYLSEELNIPVKKMTLPKSIDTSDINLTDEDSVALISLIGAILGYGEPGGLLPHEYRVEKIEFIEKVSLRMMAIFLGFALLVSFLFIKLRIDDYNERLKQTQLQKGALSHIKELQDKLAERRAFLTQAQMSEISTEYMMKELSNIIPPNVVLDWLSINQKGKTLDMKGVFYGPRPSAEGTLTKFMEGLERSRYFKDAQLTSVQAQTGKEDASGFEITCSLE